MMKDLSPLTAEDAPALYRLAEMLELQNRIVSSVMARVVYRIARQLEQVTRCSQ